MWQMAFCRGSHFPLNGLQPFFVSLIVLVLCQGAKVNISKDLNLVYTFENRPSHHNGKGQYQDVWYVWGYSQFAKTILPWQFGGQGHRDGTLGFKA